jgi:hypothetical protein
VTLCGRSVNHCRVISKRKWFRESFPLAWQLLISQLWLLLALLTVSCFLNITAEDAMQLSTPGQDTQRWAMQLTLGIWDLIEGILLLVLLSWAIPNIRPSRPKELLTEPFAAPYLSSFLAEYLRVLAQVLMWGLLLLIPGFFRYCQLIFVPFVTLFSKSYREGELDALKMSERIASGRLWLIVFGLGIPMALQMGVEFLPQMVPELHILELRILFAALSFLISIWTYSLMYLLFESVVSELTSGE